MSQQLSVGNFAHGLTTNPLAFNIDNDAFPLLINAYQWRGRIKRKRGTSFLGRLTRFFNSANISYGTITSFNLVAGAGNLLTSFSLQSNGNIVPGSVTFTDSTQSTVYTDPTKDGSLTATGGTGTGGTINYATGAITITGATTDTINTVSFLYYPDLPVMGIEDLVLNANQFPGTLAFDTVYSYNISTSSPYNIYDVSFYKNPASTTINSIAYTQKSTPTPTTWNGQNYQQFWTANYQNALWATNGINSPFSVTNIGMQYKSCASVTYVSATQLTITITETSASLIIGDWVFINEVTGTNSNTVNLQTGFVTASSNDGTTTTLTVRFPYANISNQMYANGILQYLTNRSDTAKDCLRWYDGDPTDGNATSPTLNKPFGWVNFAPPISSAIFSIDDQPALQYYLVGARIILPFKDRILFIGPVIQTSSAGSQVYLQDTIIYSQNGTPYYTASFTGAATSAATTFNALLTPANQGASPGAYFSDVTGLGGYITAGVAEPILTAGPNEDVLIIGFSKKQARLVYSGNDLLPFNFYLVNSEYGSGSTFSAITFDRGILSLGQQGIIQTAQIGSQRIDLQIPDQIFEINLTSNGAQRVTAQRDFINEWVYFTYPSNEVAYVFPNQTLQYNYRDQSWAIFNECYTTYGQFRRVTGDTWATIGNRFPTWSSWTEPWNAGVTNLLQQEVIAGNQQGFIVTRDSGTAEANSLEITSFSGSTVTSPNHCLNPGDYIVISGTIGTISSEVNGNIFSIGNVTTNTFDLNPNIGSGTYFGGGVIQRMYVPQILSKQFPVSWNMARKTRIGVQQYLFSTTNNGQITLLIFLSQNQDDAYNNLEFPNPVAIVPNNESLNNSLIYSTVIYTCPEGTNLGLTPTNINLNMVTGIQQSQIWHRMNTSLLGDTVQVGITLNDAQMRDSTFSNQFAEIELHGFILTVSPSQLLA